MKTATVTSPAVHGEVRVLLDELSDHWNRADARGYARLFTPDAAYVQFNGVVLDGRAEIEDMHDLMFRTMLYGTRLLCETIESVRLVDENTAVVVSTGAALFPWQHEVTAKRLSRQTMVLVRSEGRWMIASFQNSRVKLFPTSGPLFEVASRAVRFRVDRALRARQGR
ncbi:SgcJ/EcaC family oxidoreductase [Streptomyces sp. ISL-66]|uniref:SgcJ/EcaC family oxidoreductase n=1 Tax=Streptomyces sp. ISL-66 TaxID=2819186 RepID=UPI001BE5416B|nr:SgcJ/EcaC family oxidoreductase [Streptomyces sp. ISL-66]MBT2467903.1 SgcJ/EcaC family oxidoreductase [Streptomyces sp. ISL-66]